MPEDPNAEAANEKAAAKQDSHIGGMMKVSARFPGMIVDRDDYDDCLRRQVYPEFKAFHSKHREVSSENNPLSELFKLLCTKGEEMTKKKTPHNVWSALLRRTHLPAQSFIETFSRNSLR